jgi:hypothetical protein
MMMPCEVDIIKGWSYIIRDYFKADLK